MRAIAPHHWRSDRIMAHRYDPDINRAHPDFVESYPLAVLPASTRKCTLGARLEHDKADRFAPESPDRR